MANTTDTDKFRKGHTMYQYRGEIEVKDSHATLIRITCLEVGTVTRRLGRFLTEVWFATADETASNELDSLIREVKATTGPSEYVGAGLKVYIWTEGIR